MLKIAKTSKWLQWEEVYSVKRKLGRSPGKQHSVVFWRRRSSKGDEEGIVPFVGEENQGNVGIVKTQ